MTSRRLRPFARLALVASLAGPLTVSFAVVAHAGDGTAAAADHFKRGVDFSKNGDFEAALAEFKRAYELSPNYRVLYNLGQTSRELRDYAGALRSFRRYLDEGRREAPKRDKVEAWIKQLEGMVGTLTIDVNLPGAEVSVDDVVIGTAPLPEPLVVSAGRRKVAARFPGHVPIQEYVEIAGTDRKRISLALVLINAPSSDAGKPPPEAPRKPSFAPWAALIGTGAVVVVTGILGGVAISAKHGFEGRIATFPGDRAEIDAARSKMRSTAVAADVFGVLAAGGAVATGVLFAVQPRDVTKDATVEVRAGFGSVVVTGRF